VQLPADEIDTQLLQDAARKEAMQGSTKQAWAEQTDTTVSSNKKKSSSILIFLNFSFYLKFE